MSAVSVVWCGITFEFGDVSGAALVFVDRTVVHIVDQQSHTHIVTAAVGCRVGEMMEMG